MRRLLLILPFLVLGCSKKHSPLGLMRTPETDVVRNGEFTYWGNGDVFVNTPNLSGSTASYWQIGVEGRQEYRVTKAYEGDNPCLRFDITYIDPANLQSNGYYNAKYNGIQQMLDASQYAGKTLTVSARVRSWTPGTVLTIGVQTGIKKSNQHTGSGNWETLTVTRVLPENIWQLYVYVGYDSVADETGGPPSPSPSVGTFFVDDVVGDAE